ncbi:DUF2490 domain-containing protein [bacterium]|nr:DUF2490 domain-containing protein [bacterium]
MRSIVPRLVLSAVVCIWCNAAAADNTDWGQWGEYGIKAKLSPGLSFSTHVQYRLQDNMSDLYFIRWESGVVLKAAKYLDLAAFYRLNPQEKNGEWDNQHYLLLDQILKSPALGPWSLDFRSRVHIRLGDLGRGFWRPRFQVSHKIGKTAGWFAYNEFWIQTTALQGRDRYNTNWLSTGFKFKLPAGFEFSPYYLLRNDKIKGSADWTTQHILGTSLYYSF